MTEIDDPSTSVIRSPHSIRLSSHLSRMSFGLSLMVVFTVLQTLLALVSLWVSHPWLQSARLITLLVLLFPVLVVMVRTIGSAKRGLLREIRQLEHSAMSGMSLSGDWIWTIDRQARFTYTTPSVMSFLGFSVEECLGRDSVTLMTPAAADASVRATLEELAAQRTGWSGWDLELKRRDGSIRFVRSDALPLLNSAGELIGWQGTARDRTEYKLGVREMVESRHDIESVIRDPVSHLGIALQPIFDLGSGRAIGYEALSRFPIEPVRGPDVWFAAAHEVGLGVELECAAISRALDLLGTLPGGRWMSINVSPAAFLTLTPHTPPLVGHPCSRVILEITEHTSISEDLYPDMRRQAEALRGAGIQIAVDDAGAGFASFSHVLELGPDFIKLDRSIVRGIDEDGFRSALAVSISGFSDRIGAAIIAEGIETELEMKAIRRAGIRLGQGFGLARPSEGPVPEAASELHRTMGR